ncbi:MAG: cupin domain-containing protein [Thermoanaerobaculia bacterium]|nr:cupin domain-containing protein [Thermoanaerobaculia bacterium]
MKSRVVRGEGLRWPAAPPRVYKEDAASFCEVNRRVLLGSAVGDALAFEMRYFEVAAGGFTSFERHEHPHAVVVLAGRGEVRLLDGLHPLAPFDVVYVAPGEAHQFRAAADDRLGILCVVDHERDRPVLLDDA